MAYEAVSPMEDGMDPVAPRERPEDRAGHRSKGEGSPAGLLKDRRKYPQRRKID